MNYKAKGSNAERELQHLFWDKGWACVRVAGSGSSRHPAPDLLTSNKIRTLAIECKSSGLDKKYIKKEEIDQIILFARLFSAEPWIAIRFDSKEWFFLMCEDLKNTGNSYVINQELMKTKGLLFEEIIKT